MSVFVMDSFEVAISFGGRGSVQEMLMGESFSLCDVTNLKPKAL